MTPTNENDSTVQLFVDITLVTDHDFYVCSLESVKGEVKIRKMHANNNSKHIVRLLNVWRRIIENPKSMLPNVYRNIDVFQSPKKRL